MVSLVTPHEVSLTWYPPDTGSYNLLYALQKDHQYGANILLQTLPSDQEQGLLRAGVKSLDDVFHKIVSKMWFYLRHNIIEAAHYFYDLVVVRQFGEFDKFKQALCKDEVGDNSNDLETFNCKIARLFENLKYIIDQTEELGWVTDNGQRLPEDREKVAFFIIFGTVFKQTFNLKTLRYRYPPEKISFELYFDPEFLKPFYHMVLTAVAQSNEATVGTKMPNFNNIVLLYTKNCQQGKNIEI